MTELEEFVRSAVRPAVRDVLEARAEILEALSRGGTANRESFASALLERRGVAPAAAHDERMQVIRNGIGEQTVAADDPAIVRQRTDFAVREALGQLVADGIVLQAAGSYYGPNAVNVPAEEKGSWGGGITVQDSAPVWGGDGWNSRWRLTRPADHPSQLLARADLADGLEEGRVPLSGGVSRSCSASGSDYAAVISGMAISSMVASSCFMECSEK